MEKIEENCKNGAFLSKKTAFLSYLNGFNIIMLGKCGVLYGGWIGFL